MLLRTLIVAVAASLAIPALAQTPAGLAPPARLKGEVVVTTEVVRIGDIVDNAGSAADVAVFRAPDLGATGTVSVARVLDALRAQNVLIVDTAGLRDIQVTHAGRAIPPKEIEAQIMRALAGQVGTASPERLTITGDRPMRTVYVDTSAGSELQIWHATYDPRTARFDVTFTASATSTLRYTGTLIETVDAATLNRPIGRGEIIRAADVTIERRPRAEITGDFAIIPSEVVGLAARQPLRAGQPIKRADLVKPEIVKRDEAVTIIYEVPGITLTVRGKAIEAGAEGDTINVLNIQSKRTVQGVIVAPGRVVIAAPPPPATVVEAVNDGKVSEQSESVVK